MSPPDAEASTVPTSTASVTTLLVLVQLISKVLTFAANQLILRDLPPATLGVATQLELYLITILFFSRESIRLSIQRQPLVVSIPSATVRYDIDAIDNKPDASRQPSTQEVESQTVVNMSYLSLGMGFLFAAILGASYFHFASDEVSQTSSYHRSVIIITIASLLELASEPFFNVIQRFFLYKRRALVEMSAAFIKSLVTCSIYMCGPFGNKSCIDVLPFALGHLSYACTLLGGFFVATRKVPSEQSFSLLPTRFQSIHHGYLMNIFPWSMISLAASVFLQSIVKHLLTQGDSMILAAMTSLEDQGIYALASNYGGLVARIVFQPIEESSRSFFSSLLHSSGPENQRAKNLGLAKKHLAEILRAYGIIAAVAFPLGPALVPLVLDFIGGRSWASTKVNSLLSLYCLYIPFLAFNGISEAFVSSAASPSEVRKQALWMGGFSACFVSAAYLFLVVCDLGAQGMIYANIVNMAIRTTWSFSFIRSFLQRRALTIELHELLPKPQTFLAGIVTSTLLMKRGSYRLNSGNIVGTVMYSALYIMIV
ncbi:Rft-1-domain-containing protein [Aspergillus saccharolyticus JOP 1030-1]|uniref:Man(5)GlcNAc(2)-PP-dolichol translocation protein RFT1 n=1 Tax=Aspergillus saccharolyticus JOP 1030-1 TaxID=1450539 RepID=A0A318ZJK2_9EURO|nr:Rft-1-domain-containing protein [Aspergillus saccharolyticus JOP 1030-1]PYH47709.1 Rft-1-domain-containing protein [Aspergillus saccharolyticus JOP 1030-1]